MTSLPKEESKMYHVIFLNDDVTPFDFVKHVLVKHMSKSNFDARRITREAHITGQASAGTFEYEEAVRLINTIADDSHKNAFPLSLKIEPVHKSSDL